MTDLIHDLVSLRDVWQARKRIQSHITETPLHHSIEISQDLKTSIYVKLENMHEIGAFKIRGATNKMLALSQVDKEKGVTTFSTGNHGLAVAYLSKKLGIKAIICISNRVPYNKVERLERFGAKVIKVGASQDDAEIYAYELQRKEGVTVIPPFDDREVIAGQGTIGLELLQQLPMLDMAIIPVSGGGLLAGIGLVLKHYNPNIKIIGVSMEDSPVMYESLQKGQIVTLKEQDTLADSLLGGIGVDNRYTFQMVKQYMDEFILLTEDEIAQGMAYMFQEHQLAIEGAAATGIAAILNEKIQVKNKQIATIITGRNVEASLMMEVCQKNI